MGLSRIIIGNYEAKLCGIPVDCFKPVTTFELFSSKKIKNILTKKKIYVHFETSVD